MRLLLLIEVALVGWATSADSTLTSEEQEDAELSKVPKIFDYGDYVAKYQKNYGPVETLNKANLFFGRTLKIFHHNLQFAHNKKDYFLKQTEYIDLTPKELKRDFVTSDMEPVQGADKYPDMPADQAARLQLGKAAKIDSMASTEETSTISLKPGPDDPTGANSDSDPLTMMDDDDVGDARDVINMLKMQPDLARRLAQIVDDKDPKKQISKLTEKEIELIRKKKGVKYVPIVPSNNKNYNHMQIHSMAGTSYATDKNSFSTNYAQFLMDGFDFGLDIKPYPVDAKKIEEQDRLRESPMSMANLFGSVSQIFESLTAPFSEEEDTEESGGYIEPVVVIKDHFADHGVEEKQHEKDEEELKKKKKKKKKAGEIEFDVDKRETGCITSVKSQKDCDSCYAFTVMAILEYFYCKQTKKLTDFSAQYLVDCGGKTNLRGCKGGTITNVGVFVKDYGLELQTIYPYIAREGECPYDNQSQEKKKNGYIRPTIKHWTRFTDINAWYKWLPRSPLVVGINMPSDFHAYGGGIHDGLDCVTELTHAMLLVGSGAENGKKFWLLKNSYSDQWGEAGYFRIAHSAPLRCFDSAFVIRVNFDGTSNG